MIVTRSWPDVLIFLLHKLTDSKKNQMQSFSHTRLGNVDSHVITCILVQASKDVVHNCQAQKFYCRIK